MAKSKEYSILTSQLANLREHLLPSKFDPTGVYSSRKLKRAIAYRVLAHAELEAYFEGRVKEIALAALRKWKTSGTPSSVLMALLAFSGKEMECPPPSLAPPQPSQVAAWEEKKRLGKRVESAASAFFHVINNNHGIKELNLLKLLLPIGFSVDKLDPVWLADMDSFGAARGQYAHLSSATMVINPEDELKRIKLLLKGVQQVDSDLNLI